MPVYTDTFSARSRYQLQLHIAPQPYNQAGNYTDISWSLRIVETTENGSYSYAAAPWSATIDGQTWSGSAPYDFRSIDTLTVGSGSKRAYHDANGYKTISVSGSVGGSTTIGTASTSASLALTRIPKPPAAPTITGTVNGQRMGPQDIKTTSMVVKFSGNSSNGATIDAWQLQYATNPSFTGATTISSNGTSTLTGLSPGTTYYFRARGHNVAGWGAWSTTVSATTLTAVYVSDGTTWHSADVYVSDGSRWLSPEVWVSNGTAWVQPLA